MSFPLRAPFFRWLFCLAALTLGACGDEPPAAIDAPTDPGTLAAQLEAAADAGAAKAPAQVVAAMGQAARELEASGLLARAKTVGAQAPEFRLQDALGTPVSLSALRLEGPVVLAFYRGKW
jgi:hypothetical protein